MHVFAITFPRETRLERELRYEAGDRRLDFTVDADYSNPDNVTLVVKVNSDGGESLEHWSRERLQMRIDALRTSPGMEA